MEESLDAIMRLLTETEPFTHKTDWFELVDAHLQLRPFTQPHFPVAVASAQSPTGMKLAGKHGATPLSLTFARSPGGFYHNTLKDLWNIAEETAAQYGKTMRREEWGLVLHAFVSESRDEAMETARLTAGSLQRDYFENTIGMSPVDAPIDKIIDHMVEAGAWTIGTPDDLVQAIHRLDEESGGFGNIILLATEVGTREQVMHSYELIARYVMPKFQGSLDSLQMSQDFFGGIKGKLADQRERALASAGTDYEAARSGWKR